MQSAQRHAKLALRLHKETMTYDWKRSTLGRTGISVGRIGLAAGYGADQHCVELGFERGVNYFYWGTFRRDSFGEGLRNLRSQREKFVLVIQSYTRLASLLDWSLERALRALKLDYTDVLLLGMWNKDVTPAIWERALRLRDRGLVKHLAISTHNRMHGLELAKSNDVDVLHVRHNAIHRGAEREIFPHLPERAERPGIVSFTATSWGELLTAKKLRSGDKVPTASDAYRFVLSNPNIDVCLTGPKSAEQFSAALDAFDEGPMSEEELAWMRRVGDAKYEKAGAFSMRG
jgi:aryl-alcohol dehydrogenase-like predicted oxidoreductase